MSNWLACNKCHEVVVKSVNDEVKIRAKVLIVRDARTYAICKGCGSELEVPLSYSTSLAKSLAQVASGPRLYLKK